jgi:hypothetical protein
MFHVLYDQCFNIEPYVSSVVRICFICVKYMFHVYISLRLCIIYANVCLESQKYLTLTSDNKCSLVKFKFEIGFDQV